MDFEEEKIYDVYNNCVPGKKIPLKGWTRHKKYEGSNPVYEVCKEKDCNYIMKLYLAKREGWGFDQGGREGWSLTPGEAIRDFNKERCMQKICSDHGFCKPIHDWWICKDVEGGVIITEKLDTTLEEVIDKYVDLKYEGGEKFQKFRRKLFEILKQVLDKLFHIHQDLGIIHGDFHGGNIMLDKKDVVFFIDMETARFITDPLTSAYSKIISKDYTKLQKFIRLTEFGPLFGTIGEPLEEMEDNFILPREKIKEITDKNPLYLEEKTINKILEREKYLYNKAMKLELKDF